MKISIQTSLLASLLLLPAGQACAETYHNVEEALKNPNKVTILSITEADRELKHLPKDIGLLSHLKILEISCMEELMDLPKEIGNLTELEKLISNNGNGCVMNVKIPDEIGLLKNLKILELYGALDARSPNITKTPLGLINPLPKSIGQLQNLQELNLGRNGLSVVPPAISTLAGTSLKRLNLEFNNLRTVPPFLGLLDQLEELNLDYNRKLRMIPDEIGKLKNLKILSICGNMISELPHSLMQIKGLNVLMGNNSLTLKQQKKLHDGFPDIEFSFENDEDGHENEVITK